MLTYKHATFLLCISISIHAETTDLTYNVVVCCRFDLRGTGNLTDGNEKIFYIRKRSAKVTSMRIATSIADADLQVSQHTISYNVPDENCCRSSTLLILSKFVKRVCEIYIPILFVVLL